METKEYNINQTAIVFVVLTAIFHILFFVVESLLWLEPYIHENVLSKSDSSSVDLLTQAHLMETVFFNQGFYNLFLAIGLFLGLFLYKGDNKAIGFTLVAYICTFAFGAAVVLALSAGAIAGAIVQGLPPMIALIFLYLGLSKES